jgi:two-component system, NarL family, nitrate/nitrite response regulator NarL
MTTLLIADDHPMIRSAVALLLEGSKFEIVAQVADAQAAIEAVERHRPDVVIADIAMPGGSGIELLRALRAKSSEPRVILLTAAIDDHGLADAISLAVDGIVMKNSDPAYLLDCLESVRQGRQWLDPELKARAAAMAERGTPETLSPRERQLVGLVAKGLRNREIGEQLGVTEGTVKVYLHSIFEKLGVASRTELAMRAGQLSLLQRP